MEYDLVFKENAKEIKLNLLNLLNLLNINILKDLKYQLNNCIFIKTVNVNKYVIINYMDF